MSLVHCKRQMYTFKYSLFFCSLLTFGMEVLYFLIFTFTLEKIKRVAISCTTDLWQLEKGIFKSSISSFVLPNVTGFTDYCSEEKIHLGQILWTRPRVSRGETTFNSTALNSLFHIDSKVLKMSLPCIQCHEHTGERSYHPLKAVSILIKMNDKVSN